MKLNLWQKINEIISGMKAGDAAYRAQADTVKAAAPAIVAGLEQVAVKAATSAAEQKASQVLTGGTQSVLDEILKDSILKGRN